jgi:hypothetical protein
MSVLLVCGTLLFAPQTHVPVMVCLPYERSAFTGTAMSSLRTYRFGRRGGGIA